MWLRMLGVPRIFPIAKKRQSVSDRFALTEINASVRDRMLISDKCDFLEAGFWPGISSGFTVARAQFHEAPVK
jgi:hypothetical protein